jgi:hypothetical protein
MSRERPIITIPIPAFFRISIPLEYLFSSPAEVSIKKPAYKQSTKATVANIPSAQLMKFLMEVMRASPFNPSCVHGTPTSATYVVSPSCADTNKGKIPLNNMRTATIYPRYFFIVRNARE